MLVNDLFRLSFHNLLLHKIRSFLTSLGIIFGVGSVISMLAISEGAKRQSLAQIEAMGIDKTRIKLTAFALGAFWAGLIGVIFAAKTTFVNPASFTFMESAIILAIVVLGGMGSIIGVICGALILILLPEYLRPLSEYRMLAFGAILVVMMIFKPEGLIAGVRRTYCFRKRTSAAALQNDE